VNGVTPLLSARAPRVRQTVVIAALATIVSVQAAHTAQDVAVEAERQENALAVHAHATLRTPLPVIWRTLTDYNHLANFIPGIRKSRVVERRGNTAIVEQAGEASVFIFRYPITVTLEADEHYPAMIGVRILNGNLRQLSGAYRIESVYGSPDEFVLRWRGVIEPDIPLPLFLTAPGLRDAVEDEFRGMVREIERRQTLQVSGRPD
jgi:ribosome-associated toxin RatA of RatAB toxin-antitoxin module